MAFFLVSLPPPPEPYVTVKLAVLDVFAESVAVIVTVLSPLNAVGALTFTVALVFVEFVMLMPRPSTLLLLHDNVPFGVPLTVIVTLPVVLLELKARLLRDAVRLNEYVGVGEGPLLFVT